LKYDVERPGIDGLFMRVDERMHVQHVPQKPAHLERRVNLQVVRKTETRPAAAEKPTDYEDDRELRREQRHEHTCAGQTPNEKLSASDTNGRGGSCLRSALQLSPCGTLLIPLPFSPSFLKLVWC
jgi:hypothetical protein